MVDGHPSEASLTVDQVTALVDEHFPQVHAGGKIIFVEAVGPGSALVRMAADERTVRPGGTISGPAMFMLADVAVYVAILGARGVAALQAVTTNLSMNFLRRPPQRDLLARVRLLKVGRRLAIGEVEIVSAEDDALVAHAVATYAMPAGS
jgi:uncharacterized protein (TIGR00369 family)